MKKAVFIIGFLLIGCGHQSLMPAQYFTTDKNGNQIQLTKEEACDLGIGGADCQDGGVRLTSLHIPIQRNDALHIELVH